MRFEADAKIVMILPGITGVAESKAPFDPFPELVVEGLEVLLHHMTPEDFDDDLARVDAGRRTSPGRRICRGGPRALVSRSRRGGEAPRA